MFDEFNGEKNGYAGTMTYIMKCYIRDETNNK